MFIRVETAADKVVAEMLYVMAILQSKLEKRR